MVESFGSGGVQRNPRGVNEQIFCVLQKHRNCAPGKEEGFPRSSPSGMFFGEREKAPPLGERLNPKAIGNSRRSPKFTRPGSSRRAFVPEMGFPSLEISGAPSFPRDQENYSSGCPWFLPPSQGPALQCFPGEIRSPGEFPRVNSLDHRVGRISWENPRPQATWGGPRWRPPVTHRPLGRAELRTKEPAG